MNYKHGWSAIYQSDASVFGYDYVDCGTSTPSVVSDWSKS